ncbi:MAG: peroxide stress protein YaaA [Formivibrio sp.]|nr:peroxide stress protein YaaA [Formivibrio sp.]
MLMLISPAKTLDTTTPPVTPSHSTPAFLTQSAKLISILKKKSPQDLAELMGLSDKLALLNFERFQSWQSDFTPDNAKPAVLTFMGDVYEGMDAASFTPAQFDYLIRHLRILSGLYGLLRPLDLMQPYRLEMGTHLPNKKGRDLYAFWGDTLTEAIKALNPGVVINLASNEYFKAVHPKKLSCPVITPVFEEWHGGKYKIISFHAKRARGLMVRWAALYDVTDPQQLKNFDLEGYAFDPAASDETTWRMRRQHG